MLNYAPKFNENVENTILRYILGLDLGTASVGWSVMEVDADNQPIRIIKTGVRIFDMMGGINPTDYSAGKNSSPAEVRRMARLHRRQIQRSAHRRTRILILLQKYDLLPKGEIFDRTGRVQYFADLDATLMQAWFNNHPTDYQWRNHPDTLHVFPYKLRGAAITEPLPPHAFGRAIYHLAQRRGFKSNRKEEALLQALEDNDKEIATLTDEAKELGVVKADIDKLSKSMCEAGAATVGQYLSKLTPSQVRVRGQHTSRAMIEAEFELLWKRQRELYQKETADGKYPAWLKEAAYNKIKTAIFFQRPLRSQKGLVGSCSLEPGQKRATFNCMEAQEFRLLQKLNDLAWFDKEQNRHKISENKTHWSILSKALMEGKNVSFAEARRLLALPKGSKFNFEYDQDKESKLIGHKINARMLDAFGADWFGFSTEKQEVIIHDLASIRSLKLLKQRACDVWGLDESHAKKFARGFIDDAYCDISKSALRKLLPQMRAGESYGDLHPQLYPLKLGKKRYTSLPPVLNVQDTLRNPAVIRCLSQLRKVVNTLIKEYGLPELVRIELARDMKRNKKEREKYTKSIKLQEKLRTAAYKKLEDRHVSNPGRQDIEKLLLAEECGWQCPYTGKQFGWTDLFGTHPCVEVEHILPYSRSFDDSFMNKTLCVTEYNRKKGNQTPYEATAGDEQLYEQMLERVKRFHSAETLQNSELKLDKKSFHNAEALRKGKLERFMAKDLKRYEDFINRMLNDTKHASKVAMQYIGLLYGAEAAKHVQAGRGGVTAILRGVWGLNKILGDGGTKSRDDHRHHAVDAVAIACTSPALMHNLQRIAAEQEGKNQGARLRLRGLLLPPWPSFFEDVRAAIFSFVPSIRIRRKAKGPLHNQNPYAKRTRPYSGENVYSIRKSIASIKNGKPSAKDIEDFSAKALSNNNTLQATLTQQLLQPASTGTQNKIRSVRVVDKTIGTVVEIGSNPVRYYANEINHHMPIFEIEKKGKKVWISPGPVTLLEAMQRAQAGEALVDRNAMPEGKFLFSLASGDCIRVMYKDCEEFLKVRSVLQKSRGAQLCTGTRITDARLKKDAIASKDFFELSLAQLKAGDCRKVKILPEGTAVESND